MRILGTLFVACSLGALASAQTTCPEWESGFGLPGFDAPGGLPSVHALYEYDGGAGASLYAGGRFRQAGELVVNRVARWDGEVWRPLGAGVSGGPVGGVVQALAEFDDGSGPKLVAAGFFATAGGAPANNIAAWDGTSWSPLGSGIDPTAFALQTFDDGTGTALYAGGNFISAGGVQVYRVARWDGASWSAVSATLPALSSGVNDLIVFDDGSGPTLFAGGSFTVIGGTSSRVARLHNGDWVSVGTGFNFAVRDLEIYDDGSGPALYAGGSFSTAGGAPIRGIAKWTGSTWVGVGGGVDGLVTSLCVHDAGNGPELYALGRFMTAGGVPASNAARWNGSTWSALDSGVSRALSSNAPVQAVASFATPAGRRLAVGGSFLKAGDKAVADVASWDGSDWSSMGRGDGIFGALVDSRVVLAIEEVVESQGTALYVGGKFETAGDVLAPRIARWDGTRWSALGTGIPGGQVRAIAGYDAGNGLEVYAGGSFNSAGGQSVSRIARWDGSTWSDVGGGCDLPVHALEVFDDGAGETLFVAGRFDSVGAGIPASRVARWDGNQWSPLGQGPNTSVVSTLAVFDDGTGAALYAGGAGTVSKWNGTNWVGTPTLPGNDAQCLAVFDDGTGPALYSGGANFTLAWPLSVLRNGVWLPVTSGISSDVHALHVLDTGSGPNLYVGGNFQVFDGVQVSRLARWNGAQAFPVSLGTDERVFALGSLTRAGVSTLLAGGKFATAGGVRSYGIGSWSDPCDRAPSTYCQGKRNSAGCVPFVVSSGRPSASSAVAFDIVSRDAVPSSPGLLTYGFGRAQVAFHGGTACVRAPFVRAPTRMPQATGAGCSGWELATNFNGVVQSGTDPRLSVGSVVFAQWRQQDPADPQGFGDSLSDGLRFAIGP